VTPAHLTPNAPTSSLYPSGISPPAVQPGYTRNFDDFLSTSLGPLWSGAYNGKSGAAQDGIFLATHLVLNGDSLLRLEAYSDANWSNSFGSTSAIAAAVHNVCGAGVQTGTRWPVGTTFSWACKWDTYPGLTPIVLTMGNNWPPEQDIIESDVNSLGAPQTGFNESFLYAPGPTQKQNNTPLPSGITDFSTWHLWQLQWTSAGSKVFVDGHMIPNVATPSSPYTMPFTSGMVSGVNGLQNNQFLALQHQTGDPNDPSSTINSPVTMFFDWVAIDTP
jgi:hypothetical protein